MSTAFAPLSKTWRRKRRLSQLELAMTAGVSQRHVSFLESGRAGPSRGMILQLSEALAVPLRERNVWLTAAGFAPVFPARGLEDPQMGQVLGAVRMMLLNHEPFPAVAVDRDWNVVLSNGPFDWVCGMLGEDFLGRSGRNLLRLFFHPEGIRPYVVNWDAVAPLLRSRAIWWRIWRGIRTPRRCEGGCGAGSGVAAGVAEGWGFDFAVYSDFDFWNDGG